MTRAGAAPTPVHRGLALGLSFSAGGLYGWSAVIPALQSRFDTSVEEAGLVFSLSIVAFSIAVYGVPRLPVRFQGLRGAALAASGGALALVCAAYAPSYPAFVAAFGIGFGGASGALYILVLDLAAGTDRPRIWTPVMVASFGLGGALFGPIMRVMVESGWELLALLPLAACLIGLTVPSWLMPPLATPETAAVERQDAVPVRLGSARMTIGLLWLTFAFGSTAGLMTLGLAATIVEVRGAPVWLSSAALSGIAIGNTAGRLSVGALSGAVRPCAIVVLAAVLTGSGLVLSGLAVSPAATAAGLVVVATGYGAIASGIPTLTGAIVGAGRFGRVFSVVFTGWGTAGLIAPWAAGRLFDTTGSFAAAIYGALGLTVLAGISAAALCRLGGGQR